MKWKTRQSKVEDYTYDAIEDIAEEIGVNVPFYPEVYWVGRKLQFEDLGLSNLYREEFDEIKCMHKSIYLVKPKIILINRYSLEEIGEEAGHFLHLTSSKINSNKIKGINDFCLYSLVEMFGFFCSKLVKPDRKNPFKRYKDTLLINFGKKKTIKGFFEESYKYTVYSAIHQQGYGLGEELFNAYISGVISKKKIRSLFLNSLSKKNEAIETFFKLKNDLVGYLKPKK